MRYRLKREIDWPPKETKRESAFPQSKFTYKERSEVAENWLLKEIFQKMERKKTNICLAADITTKKEMLEVVEEVGPYVCMVKTHMETMVDFDEEVIQKLTDLAEKYDFVLLEDRKFADVGSIVQAQFEGIFSLVTVQIEIYSYDSFQHSYRGKVQNREMESDHHGTWSQWARSHTSSSSGWWLLKIWVFYEEWVGRVY